MQIIKAIGRKELGKVLYEQNLKDTLLVDSYNGAAINMDPFVYFNPFHTFPKPQIPVPGSPRLLSLSIEGIWQGTKYINGETDLLQLNTIPYKRPAEQQRKIDKSFDYSATQFIYDNTIINHVEARFMIYLLAYLYLLNVIIPDELVVYIKQLITDGKSVIFCDWDENFDITNVSESFSHSTILASWFRNTLVQDFLPQAKEMLSNEYYSIFIVEFHKLIERYNKIHR